MTMVTGGDRDTARRLPAECMGMRGLPVDRLVDLISRDSGGCAAAAKVDLDSSVPSVAARDLMSLLS